MLINEVYDDLATIMLEVSAEQVKDKTRREPVPALRYMIWARMSAMGFSTPKIGRVAGYSHSTVVHGIQFVKYMEDHPMMFWDIIETYYKFNDKANEYIYERTNGVPLEV